MPAEMTEAQKTDLVRKIAVSHTLGMVGKGKTITLPKTALDSLTNGVDLDIVDTGSTYEVTVIETA